MFADAGGGEDVPSVEGTCWVGAAPPPRKPPKTPVTRPTPEDTKP